MLARAHCILIPVAPSAIDIHATANFIRDLLLAGKIRARDARLAVLANRVAARCRCISRSSGFLSSLSLAFLTRLGDSDVYVKAAETGVGSSSWTPRCPPPSARHSCRSSSGSTASKNPGSMRK